MSSSSDASSPAEQDSPPSSYGSFTPPPESTLDPPLNKDSPPPPSDQSSTPSPDQSGGGSSSSPPNPSPDPPNSPPPSLPLPSPRPKSPPPSSPPPSETPSLPSPSPESSKSPPSRSKTPKSPPPSPSKDHGDDGDDSSKRSPPPSTTPSPPRSSPAPPTSDNSPPPAEKSPTQDFKSPPVPPASGPPGPNINPTSGTPDTNPNLTPANSSADASLKTPSESNSHSSANSGDSSSPPPASESLSSSSSLLALAISMAVLAVVIIAVLCLIFFFCRRKKHYRSYVHAAPLYKTSDGNYYPPQHTGIYSSPHDPYYTQGSNPSYVDSYGSGNPYQGPDMANSKSFFSYEELMEITCGFTSENILGEGGFGAVYKGFLSDGKVVAVKQLKAGSGQGEREFRAEVEIINRVHHRHLVSLVGYCISDHHRLLIYEFVPNNTLEHHLHAKGIPVLDWSKRMKIAVGAAKGLAYLHEDCHPKIIHRDIKSANILLDDVYEAQVADFGLAKLSNDTGTHVSTRVMGTFGYMAPEYASSGKLTDRSDVFSFGVVLLELLTGHKPVDPTLPLGDESLVEWARPMLSQALKSGEVGELVDPKLEKQYVESELFRMIEAAAACVRHSAGKRPRMAQVVRALDTDGGYDLSDGMKYGQSTVYESGQYKQDIMKFRMMALEGIGDSSEYNNCSGDYATKELSGPLDNWKSPECSSGELETRAFTGSKKSHTSRRF